MVFGDLCTKGVLDLCMKQKVKVLSAPPFKEWSDGELKIKQIREIRIEDLGGQLAHPTLDPH